MDRTVDTLWTTSHIAVLHRNTYGFRATREHGCPGAPIRFEDPFIPRLGGAGQGPHADRHRTSDADCVWEQTYALAWPWASDSPDEEQIVNSFTRRAVTLASGGLLAVIVSTAASGAAFAAPTPAPAGQPNQSCEEQPNTPGQAASAPGSPFNPDGTAGGVYAGEQPQNSKNPKSVSQYDVACFQVSPH